MKDIPINFVNPWRFVEIIPDLINSLGYATFDKNAATPDVIKDRI